ncbi:hypothetical protein XENTR_v10008160 [Xenopus tropicalis]|uniref:Calcium-activated potassium channel subunit beta-1 n=2 Tax=Xenopus TaxID=8353 RepID=A0A6I8RN52_XENTR|nr:calcium-activated potassium channel beta 1 subunit [Xenopus laevis]XP_017947681.1 calcium-activated potassium channel subunit beta-1 [Xenopus tropicalis]AEQ94265.1 calcium-activated potassium channel beta 1 subunit [Xenopus laevis]KAE8614440.1 hypothetical protein XENTR_v10008160 [Xenopus tropicalis]KAE8614441.1 hypothetical protein XENTR_v10008160 [Xenopus tropicalis]KAE8614442.1 hypothetical protein XENTR_v10008160 [Xenopus tropicalis]|eukprot:XP_017947681.1 PREDICTED: calcium-activated potassium channel subunit beta-1 [Xenopus tropicalis]
MEKKLFTVQKRGETRALCWGIGMIVCAVMMSSVFGFTVVPKFLKSVWTEESVCTVVNSSFKEKVSCTYDTNAECDKSSYYPCLEVLVNVNFSQHIYMLYHTEETPEMNDQCSYIPKCEKNYTEVKMHVDIIQENFMKNQPFTCFYDPKGGQKSIILSRKFGLKLLISYFFWPASMFTVGLCIVIMVKISQYLAMVAVQSNKVIIR